MLVLSHPQSSDYSNSKIQLLLVHSRLVSAPTQTPKLIWVCLF